MSAGSRKLRRRSAAKALVLAAVATTVLTVATGTTSTAPHPGLLDAPAATVVVASDAPTTSVPHSYLGFSTEYWAMPLWEAHMSLFERVLALERAQGQGPLLIRIGGDSTDHALFDVNLNRLPKGIYELTPQWFGKVRQLVGAIDARTLLDLNLVTDLPQMAGLWARAAEMQLPSGAIVGYEIGNEPDLYDPLYWSNILAPLARVLDLRLFPHGLAPDAYVRLYQSYANVLARVAPGVPLVAPVVAYPTVDLGWITRLLEATHPRLGMISAHMYPYSACAAPLSPLYPTIPRLLSEAATAGMAASLRPAIELAHRAGYPFRLTELNSVTCGGLPGVSDTFATALWAPDALFELLRAGVDGVNIHVRVYAINAAFALPNRGLVARPLLYGLAVFTRMLGPDARLVRLRVHDPASIDLKAWAVQVQGHALHVLLINKSTRSVRAALMLPAAGIATVQRLLAPSAAARSGETLNGQQLGPDDHWHGRSGRETIEPGPHGYELTVPSISAALVGVNLRAGALR
jgi:hypothetical protein